jgi:hypothetical protein
MSGEMVFTVSGSAATVAQPISLADAGLTERGHLQEWVLVHPEMLGPDVKVVAFEFGRWTATSGALARDRLDVLGLDRDGRLVVVELKRDQAPDTVDMQALTSRSWRGEGGRRRHMKNPEAATPRMRQHRLAEQALAGQLSDDRVLGLGRTPSSNSLAAWVTKASSVSNSLIRRLAAASSPRSLVEVPGLIPRSMRSWAFHRSTVASASPSSAATTRTGRPALTSSATRRRNSGS